MTMKEKEVNFILFSIEKSVETKEKQIVDEDNEEKWYTVASQVFLPFMIAGFGMVAAGLVLERVKVFIQELATGFLALKKRMCCFSAYLNK